MTELITTAAAVEPVKIVLNGKAAAGRVALIDAADYELVSAYRWHVCEPRRPDGSVQGGPYAQASLRRGGRGITINMHRLITGYAITDHVNHDGLDNRRTNLRSATHKQNSANARKMANRSSIYKGVTWRRTSRKWQAQIELGGKFHHLGYFEVEEDAGLAYAAAALEAFGEYAYQIDVSA